MYQVQNPINSAMSGMSQASGSYGAMMKDVDTKLKPTAGGAIMGGVGGATTASALGSAMGGSTVGGPVGMGVGALVGIGAYLLS